MGCPKNASSGTASILPFTISVMVVTVAVISTMIEMLKGMMEAVPLDAILRHPILNSVQHLIDHPAAFAINLATTKWGGKHGFLQLVLIETKMCLAARNQDLEHGHIKRPELLNPKIVYDTKGRDLLQFQEYHKVNWK